MKHQHPEVMRMRRRRLLCFVLVVIAALMLMAPAVRAQSNSCVDCHFANPAAPERDHLGDWERSAHGRASVGCEKCHGGDAASYTPRSRTAASVTAATRPARASPVTFPPRAGRVTRDRLVHFQKSRHLALLRSGDNRVPTCTTCHDAVASALPSPKVLKPNASAAMARKARRLALNGRPRRAF